jgi:hypothetical protein
MVAPPNIVALRYLMMVMMVPMAKGARLAIASNITALRLLGRDRQSACSR